MIQDRKQRIIDFVKNNGASSSKEIFDGIGESYSYATLKRILSDLKDSNYLLTKGQGRGAKYVISSAYELIVPIDIEKYYEKEIDQREIIEKFNAKLMNYGYCPLSFRTVDSIDYKKAMLIFYEQNNISRFKEIFISQFEFAVRTYF